MHHLLYFCLLSSYIIIVYFLLNQTRYRSIDPLLDILWLYDTLFMCVFVIIIARLNFPQLL